MIIITRLALAVTFLAVIAIAFYIINKSLKGNKNDLAGNKDATDFVNKKKENENHSQINKDEQK